MLTLCRRSPRKAFVFVAFSLGGDSSIQHYYIKATQVWNFAMDEYILNYC